MSRIRTIKPEFFIDDELAELSVLTRLLFVGLWTLADCKGRMEDRPKRIRAQLHPFDDGDTDAMLQALHDARFIHRYEVDGKRYLEIRTFTKHQRLSGKEAEEESRLPGPAAATDQTILIEQCVIAEMRTVQQGSNGETLGKDFSFTNAQEGKGREGNRKGRGRAFIAPARNTPTAKTAFPLDLDLTASIRPWADERGYADLDRHLDHFRDKSLANGYRYADWSAAFKTAVRDDWARLRTPTPIPQARKPFAPPNRATAVDSTDPNIAEVQSILAGTYRPVIEGECHATH